MDKNNASEIRGFEFDWLACDAEGNVGFFSTAGGGHAPADFLRDTDAHDAAIDAILSMPSRTACYCARELDPRCVDTWKMMAERGVFAFDSDPNGGPYTLQASPVVPVRVDALPGVAAEVARRLVFPHLRFRELKKISANLLR